MAEEHRRCQPQKLCANNCGFLGNPATRNLCSKCYGDSQRRFDLSQPLISPSSSSPSSSSDDHSPLPSPAEGHTPAPAPPSRPAANRCAECRRRVGLTGFGCRCGATFCGTHRYPESHACGFDFKALGKDQIARANPLVKADKLHRI